MTLPQTIVRQGTVCTDEEKLTERFITSPTGEIFTTLGGAHIDKYVHILIHVHLAVHNAGEAL